MAPVSSDLQLATTNIERIDHEASLTMRGKTYLAPTIREYATLEKVDDRAPLEPEARLSAWSYIGVIVSWSMSSDVTLPLAASKRSPMVLLPAGKSVMVRALGQFVQLGVPGNTCCSLG